MTRPGFVITVTGELDRSLREEFEDVEVVVANSVTRLVLADADRAMLHGVLHRIERFGLELLDLQRVDPGPADATTRRVAHDHPDVGEVAPRAPAVPSHEELEAPARHERSTPQHQEAAP